MTFHICDAFKSLRRDAAFSVTVILTLGDRYRRDPAVFSVVNGVLLRPLAYRESQRLVAARRPYRSSHICTQRFPPIRGTSPCGAREPRCPYQKLHRHEKRFRAHA
jgi:hypothetical protein